MQFQPVLRSVVHSFLCRVPQVAGSFFLALGLLPVESWKSQLNAGRKEKYGNFASTLDKSCSLSSGKVVDSTVYKVSFWSSDCEDEHLLEVILGILKTLFSFLFMGDVT